MPHIGKIVLKIETYSDCTKNGIMYLGLGGKEFELDDYHCFDFGIGTMNEFVMECREEKIIYLSKDSGILPLKSANKIEFEDMDLYPKYLRFEPNGSTGNYIIEKVTLIVEKCNKCNEDTNGLKYKAYSASKNILLDNESGLYLGLYN